MVCSPVTKMSIKPVSSWTAWPGASILSAPAAYSDALSPRPRDLRALRGLNSCDLRVEQRFQDGQGRSVSDHLLGGMSVQAPATAHVGVTETGDVSGPFPWRPPV